MPSACRRFRRVGPRLAAVASLDASAACTLGVLALCAGSGPFLERRAAAARAVGVPVVQMAAAAGCVGLGALPAESAAYALVTVHLLPLGVCLQLLGADLGGLRDPGRAGMGMLAAFAVGALGTVLGTLAAAAACGSALGPDGWKLAACLCASYVGGSANYVAVGDAVGLAPGVLAAGVAADNVCMAAFMTALMLWPANSGGDGDRENVTRIGGENGLLGSDAAPARVTSQVTRAPLPWEWWRAGLGAVALAALCVAVGRALAPPSYALPAASLVATVVSASRPSSSRYAKLDIAPGGRVGSALMGLFFATMGASADPSLALRSGPAVLAFIGILLAVHLAVVMALGRGILGLPVPSLLLASNANVGGAATAAAMAHARGWTHLAPSALLVGSLGYAVGTPLGLALVPVLVGLRG